MKPPIIWRWVYIRTPKEKLVFSERMGYAKPILKAFGYRVYLRGNE